MIDVKHEDADDIIVGAIDVNKVAPAVKAVANLAGLQALDIFTHLAAQDKTDSETLMMKRLGLAGTSLPFAEMSCPHTQGTFDNYVGTGVAKRGGYGVGAGGGQLYTSPDGYWSTIKNIPASAVKMKVFTNIVANDAAFTSNPHTQGLIAYFVTGHLYAQNGATYGQQGTIFFVSDGAIDGTNTTPGIVAGAPVASATANVGDAGTFFAELDLTGGVVGNGIQVGGGAPFGDNQYYFIFGMQIAAPCATKTYKFKFELEYV